MIQDIDNINVSIQNDDSINVTIENDSISVSEATPTDISEIMHNEEIRQENEAQRIANEEQRISNEQAREDYIDDLKQRVLDGEFNGEDGYSPTANVSKSGTTSTITITDKNGTTTAEVLDGIDGKDGVDGKDGIDGRDGADGYSPSASVSKSGDTATITITDKNGTTTASVSDGEDGQDGTDGQDGFSPEVTMSKQGKITTLTITDAYGTHTTEIKDGNDGSGTGDMLKSTYDTNDNGIVDNAEKVNNHTVQSDVPANAVFTDTTYTAGTGIDITNNVISNTQTSAAWGNITGTLSDQTDLNTALSGKQDVIDSTHKLSSDLVDDTNHTNKFINSSAQTFTGTKTFSQINTASETITNNLTTYGSISINDEEDGSVFSFDGTSSGTPAFARKIDLMGGGETTSPTSNNDIANKKYVDDTSKMVILSYGSSTWNDFITAYNNNKVVYCRASSNANPATGSQTRLAFMAYVNNATTPTNVEFQYYRSVSSHSATQQGDQVFVYKLTNSSGGTWSVETREAMVNVDVSDGLSRSYSSNKLTISGAGKQNVIDSTHKLDADLVDDSTATNKFVTATDKTTWSGKQDAIDSSHKLSADLVNDSSTTNKFVTLTEKGFWNDKQESLVSGTNIKTINSTSLLGSGNIDVGADIPQQDTAPSNPSEDDLWIDTDEPGIVTSNKMMLVIGDSFSNNAQSGTPLWYTYVSRWHDLTVYTTASDGMGYATGNNSFLTQLQTANNDSTLTNDDVKEIYIVGGLNDLGNSSLTAANFETAVINTLEYAEEHFGNALIYVVGIFPFQWYNFYSGSTCFTDNLRAKTFQAKLSNACITSDTNRVIFKNSQYFGLSTYGYFGEANAYNQRHPSALGEKMIAQFIQTGENKFGIPDANWDECYLKETPLVVSNASNTHAWINFIDDNSISINVENYDNTKTLYIYMTGLPDSNTYLSVTDEQGHFAFMWKDYNDNKYQMPGGVGLNSGNIYLNMNTGFRD